MNEQCQQELRVQGKPYPRTCAVCGLGPCKRSQPVDVASPWQPIETALKEPQGTWGDGPRVLLRRGGVFIGAGYWSSVRNMYWSDSDGWIDEDLAPTHWAPMSLLQLPEPPK